MKKNAISKALKEEQNKIAKKEARKKFADSVLSVPPQDTSNVLAVEPDSGSVDVADVDGDSTANVPQLPTPEQLGISVSTGFTGDTLEVTRGDTINFPVTVSWNANMGSLLVVPVSSANTMDLVQLGVSQESSRIVKDGKELAQITFNYKLVVKDGGDLLIPPLHFEIPTQMGQSLKLKSDAVPVKAGDKVESFTTVLGVVAVVFFVVAWIWRMRRRANAKKVLTKHKNALYAIREHMMVLKMRVNMANSREWLLELEGVCKEFVALHLGMAGSLEAAAEMCAASGTGTADGMRTAAASAVNLDNLVNEGKLEGWEPLVKEFALARYGGGKRDSFELKEIWKTTMSLMGLKEDE